MNHQKVKNYVQGNGTNWILWYKKLPGASYIGNVWEYQIRTARGIFEGLLKHMVNL